MNLVIFKNKLFNFYGKNSEKSNFEIFRQIACIKSYAKNQNK